MTSFELFLTVHMALLAWCGMLCRQTPAGWSCQLYHTALKAPVQSTSGSSPPLNMAPAFNTCTAITALSAISTQAAHMQQIRHDCFAQHASAT